MADQYIDQSYVEARWTEDLVSSIFGAGSSQVTLVSFIEDATAEVKTVLLNSGYAAPSTTDPSEVDDYVKMAVFGRFWELVCASPYFSIQLPLDWEDNPYRLALDAIYSGKAMLEGGPDNTVSSVGGVSFSDSSSTGRPAQMTRAKLAGY